jgi:hypothetical protein
MKYCEFRDQFTAWLKDVVKFPTSAVNRFLCKECRSWAVFLVLVPGMSASPLMDKESAKIKWRTDAISCTVR